MKARSDTPAQRIYTTAQVAEMFGVNVTKVNGWIKSGDLPAINVAQSVKGSRPRYRIPDASVEQFKLTRSIVPAPAPAPRKRRSAASVPEYV